MPVSETGRALSPHVPGMVGAAGFEPAIFCSRSRRVSLATLRPEMFLGELDVRVVVFGLLTADRAVDRKILEALTSHPVMIAKEAEGPGEPSPLRPLSPGRFYVGHPAIVPFFLEGPVGVEPTLAEPQSAVPPQHFGPEIGRRGWLRSTVFALSRRRSTIDLHAGEYWSGGRESNPRDPSWQNGAWPLGYRRMKIGCLARGRTWARRFKVCCATITLRGSGGCGGIRTPKPFGGRFTVG
jgi:hypothetical protein